MLRVSIHAGPLSNASRFNQLAWLDIGYDRLDALADYRIFGFAKGDGAGEPVTLPAYPRWSGSLWDLTARAIALLLDRDADPAALTVPAYEPGGPRAAFASAISASIQHHSRARGESVTTLASVNIAQRGNNRGVYLATFIEDLATERCTEPFLFRPKFLNPAELLLHAALVHLTGQHEQIPPTPQLAVPASITVGDKDYIAIHKLIEPARTGFTRWLTRQSETPIAQEDAPQGLAPATMYAKFLQVAI